MCWVREGTKTIYEPGAWFSFSLGFQLTYTPYIYDASALKSLMKENDSRTNKKCRIRSI